MWMNPGLTITLTSSSTSRARIGQTSWWRRIRWRPVGVSGTGTLLLAGLARDDLEDVADADVVVRPLVDLAAVAHDHEAVAEPEDLLELGGDEDHRHPLGGELGDLGLDLRLRADVDAPRRLVEDQDLGVGDEPPGEQHLLLVAARQVAHQRRGVGGPDVERLQVLLD